MKNILNNLRGPLYKTRFLAMFLVFLPVLFIFFSTTVSATTLSGSDYVISNYSHNAMAFEANRLLQTITPEAAKYKRPIFSAISVLPGVKYASNLKIYSDIYQPGILNNTPLNDFKHKYLLSDLPPPSNLV
jgi:hypothetical protein